MAPVWLFGPGAEPAARLVIPGMVAGWSLSRPWGHRLLLVGIGAAGAVVLLHLVSGAGPLLMAQSLMSLALVALAHRRLSGPYLLLLLLALQISIAVVEVGSMAGGVRAGYELLRQEVARDLDTGFQTWFKAGEGEMTPEVEAAWAGQRELFLRFFPGLVTVFFLMAGLTNIWVVNRVAGRRVVGPKFSLWRIPDHLVWLLIAGGATALFTHGAAQVVALNLLLLMAGLYAVQGFAIAAYHFQRRGTPRWFRGLFYVLMGLYWYGLLSVALMGLLEVWFPLRPGLHGEDDIEE